MPVQPLQAAKHSPAQLHADAMRQGYLKASWYPFRCSLTKTPSFICNMPHGGQATAKLDYRAAACLPRHMECLCPNPS